MNPVKKCKNERYFESQTLFEKKKKSAKRYIPTFPIFYVFHKKTIRVEKLNRQKYDEKEIIKLQEIEILG